MPNSGLRRFDQSWRLDAEGRGDRRATVFRDEVDAGRPDADRCSDKAETVAQDPGSPTRLWLDRLPDGNAAARPARLSSARDVCAY